MKKDMQSNLKKLQEKLDKNQISDADYFMWLHVYTHQQKQSKNDTGVDAVPGAGFYVQNKDTKESPYIHWSDNAHPQPEKTVIVGKKYPADSNIVEQLKKAKGLKGRNKKLVKIYQRDNLNVQEQAVAVGPKYTHDLNKLRDAMFNEYREEK